MQIGDLGIVRSIGQLAKPEGAVPFLVIAWIAIEDGRAGGVQVAHPGRRVHTAAPLMGVGQHVCSVLRPIDKELLLGH